MSYRFARVAASSTRRTYAIASQRGEHLSAVHRRLLPQVTRMQDIIPLDW
jgi:hypothetical protein